MQSLSWLLMRTPNSAAICQCHSLGEFAFVKKDVCLFQMYPAQVRSTEHGISAATGKVGSIAVVVWLNYLG